MTNSKGSSVVIGDERAQDGLLAVMVVPDGSSKRLSRMFPQRDHPMAGSVNRRRSNRAWAAHTNPSVTIGLRS